jgi:hypothetical protein
MVNTSRRRFLRRSLGSAVALAAGTGLYAWRLEPRWVEFVERPLPIAGLPEALIGKRLVQLTDIHVGERVDDDYVLGVFERVRAPWSPTSSRSPATSPTIIARSRGTRGASSPTRRGVGSRR